jgi:hypothetical protein
MEAMVIYRATIIKMAWFMSFSREENLYLAAALFIITFVSLPVKTLIP